MNYNLNFPGKDDKGWSMYIDRQRSWFMHGSVHEQRSEGGIQPGSTVGVLLDLDRHQLSFYVNEEPQVCVASHGELMVYSANSIWVCHPLIIMQEPVYWLFLAP